MYLHIKGFRTIQEYECEFQSESITLISGPSGKGKTTVMNAIYWCLYGTLKNVRKFGTKSGTCMVKIDLTTIKIIRSKSPESLTVELSNEITLKDDEAQEKIIELFGSCEIWLSSCYLRQGTRNKFLESSPSERLSLLSELCFSSHSPETYVEKIDEKLKDVTKEFERQNDFYKRDLELFQKKRKEYPKYREDLLTTDQRVIFHQKIHSDKLSRLEEHLSISERLESSYLSLLDTKNQLESKFPNYKEYLLSEEQKKLLSEILLDNKSEYSPHRMLRDLEIEIQELERQKIILGNHEELFHEKKSQMSNMKEEGYDTNDERWWTKYVLSEQDRLIIETQINNLPNEIEMSEKCLREYEHQKINHENWMRQISDLETELLSLNSLSSLELLLEDLSKKIEFGRHVSDTIKRIKELNDKLDNYRDILFREDILAREVSVEEMSQSILMDKKVSERIELVTRLSIQDQKQSVQKAIDVRRRICEVQHLWIGVAELQELEMKINEYDEKIDTLEKNYHEPWISEKDLPQKILEWNTVKESLICPKCSSHLRFESKHLVECHTNISKDKLVLMGKWIEDSKRRIEWIKTKEKLQQEMNQKMTLFEENCQKMNLTQEQFYEYPKLEELERQKLTEEMLELERYISSYDQGFTNPKILNDTKRKWEAKLIQDDIDRIKIDYDISNIQDIVQLEEEKERLLSEKTRIQHLSSMINQLKQKVKSCELYEPKTHEDIKLLKNKLEQSQLDIQHHLKAKEIFDLEEKIIHIKEKDIIRLLENKKKDLDVRWRKIEDDRREWEDARKRIESNDKAETIHHMMEKLNQIIYDNPKEIKDNILSLREEIEDMKMKLLKHDKAQEIVDEKSRLEKQRMEVIELSNKVSCVSVMKSIANELEHKRMISILDTINDFTNELLTILFDEPIKIEFMVYKTTKTKDKVKPSIVYKLLYRGYEMDHVDQLSGGEGDRVSLAVTCALFQFSKFPFLLLDEFAASLDLNTKEMAIKTLKTFLGIGGQSGEDNHQNKSILCISHDTVEGIYDYTLKM